MHGNFQVYSALLLSSSINVIAQSVYNQPCPLLGVDYPNPSKYSPDAAIQAAISALLNDTISAQDGSSVYGAFLSNETAFSVDVYSLYDDAPLFTYHNTPQDLISAHTVGVEKVDSDTIYRVGSLSKLYTIYTYLIAAGDVSWSEPVAKYVPEIAALIEKTNSIPEHELNVPVWCEITIGALAAQLGGLSREVLSSPGLQQALGSFGLPPSIQNVSSWCGNSAQARIPCNRTAFFEAYLTYHPIVAPFATPVYSNPPYQILAYALENITNQSMSSLLNTTLILPLNLTNTFYTVPPSDTNAIIPFNKTISWFNADALDESPAGGYYSSINDMRALGKSILNSTFLSPGQTRRWMKPHSFTSNPNFTVGAPWEITRAPGDETLWIYTKSGDLGYYSGLAAFLPEYNVGFSVLAAGTDTNAAVRILSDTITARLVPAVQSAVKTAARATFAGSYADTATNSSITLSVIDGTPGLVVSNWTLGGLDVLSAVGGLMGVPTDGTAELACALYDSGLAAMNRTSGVKTMSWRALFQVLPEPLDTGAFSENCDSWATVNQIMDGGVGLDEFLIQVNADGSQALNVEARVVGLPLAKEASTKPASRIMRRVM